MRVLRRETEADRLRRIESDVVMLKRRVTASPLPEEQRLLVREALVKRAWPFRSITVVLGTVGAGGGALVAGGPVGAALGALAGLALPLIFEEPLVTYLSRRRKREPDRLIQPALVPDPGAGGDVVAGDDEAARPLAGR